VLISAGNSDAAATAIREEVFVLTSALSALSGRLDSKFLTAYWLPAFVAVLGGIGILAVLVGPEQMDAWVYQRDSVEQTIGALILLLLMTMLAFVLRALSRPISMLFAGDALPRSVAEWSTRGQLRVRNNVDQRLGVTADRPESVSSTRQSAQWLARSFPQDDTEIQPTLFGNVLAAASEHPWLAYAMAGGVWWPRLSPLLPPEFQDILAGAQAPMMGLLNLSVVFAALGLGGGAALGLFGGNWSVALVILVGGLLLSWLCYRAGVSQAAELGTNLRVAFDLYRYDILTQLGLEHPADLAAERALWQRLTDEMLLGPVPSSAPGNDSASSADTVTDSAPGSE
jgi:hypothetical protein